MATIKWAAYTDRFTVLTTELNALTNAGRSAAGTEINNATNLDRWGKFELSVTFGTAPTAGGYVEIYAVTAPDGTNYEDGSNAVDPGAHNFVDRIPVRSATTAQRLTGRQFPMPPAKTKFILLNASGQAFPASGSTLKLYTTNEVSVA